MAKVSTEKNWLDIIQKEYSHPATVLWRAVELRHIDEALNSRLQEPILDLGCAEGKIADIIFKYRNRKLIGLDNCWKLLKENRKSEVYKLIILADGCHLPFKDERFKGVFSNCVIEHIPDLDTLLDEVSRVLRRGGIFLFTVPSHKFGDFLFFSIIFERLGLKRLSFWYKVKRNKMLEHFHCYDHNRWRDILKIKGLSIVSYEYYMTKEATFIWDMLAILVFVIKKLWPLSYLLPVINKYLCIWIRKYYNREAKIGSGLLLICQKEPQ